LLQNLGQRHRQLEQEMADIRGEWI
jgi:hypothetical protein